MTGGGGAVERGRRPAPGPRPKITLPKFERFALDNGLSVLAVRHADLPEISARMVVPFGSAEDPEGFGGTALLVARALTEGTAQRPAREVAESLDYLGARFALEVDHDATVLSLHFLSRVIDGAFQLFAEVLTEPAFDESEVERLRDERLDEIARGLDEPRIVASLRLSEAIFGEHPYRMRAGGDEASVRRIDAQVLRRFHSTFYRPSRATLVLVGDLPTKHELRERLQVAFANWQGEPPPPRSLEEPRALDGRRLWAVQWDGPQSEIRVGGLGITRLDREYPAVMVMNAILGGLFSSRINMNLREDKGWTYGASSRFDPRRQRGPFYAATAVDARVTVDAVREILGELERMKSDPPNDEELELAKNALTLSLPRLFETVGQVSGRVAHQVIYGLPDEYWEDYGEHLRAVARDDVVRVAERLVSAERAAIVVVGPVRDFLPALEPLARVEMRDVRGQPTGL